MKILQVTNFFKPSFEAGGVTKVAYSISKYLTKNGHDVTVFTTNRSLYHNNVEINKSVNLEGMNIYYFENLRKYFPIKIPPIPYYSLFVAKKKIKDFDIIHIHEHRTLLAIIVHYYAKKYNIPYVLQPHGSAPTFEKKRFKSVFDILFGNRILEDSFRMIALNEIEAGQLKSIGIDESKIKVIPNGIDTFEYMNLPSIGEFKKKYSVNETDKIILYLGRLNKIKGIDLLIESFYDIKKDMNNVKLFIVGPDDGFLSTLKAQVVDLSLEDSVLFIGPLFDKDKLEAYVDADVYVLPSRYETFPNTVLEACLCGTPVIITDRCGISDIVDNNLGYVVKFDKNELVSVVLRFLNEDLKHNMFFSCSSIVKTNFSWSRILFQIENLYESVIRY